MKTASALRQASPSRPADLRLANARTLMRLIRTHAPCSKADLVRYSGLSAPTITSCIALLAQSELIESLGDGPSNGGRPAALLRFNAAHGAVVAVDIGGTRLRMMLADLGGTALTQWSHEMGPDEKTPAQVCSLVQRGLKEMCKASGVAVSRVLHLTAGAPGITNVQEGIVLSAPNLSDWNEVPLRAMLQAKLKIPVIVENDTNLAAVGEHLYGAAREMTNFVFLALGTGLGAGIYIDGRLHHGAHWSAGEVGYFGVGGKPRQPMRLRETGQLESMVGGGGIEARWRHAIEAGKSKPSRDLLGMRALQILDRAAEGDRTARQVAVATATLLADAIADVAVLLNPELVILGGGIGAHPELCLLTQSALERHELANGLHIRSSALGTQAQIRGAVATSVEEVQTLLLPQ